MIFMPSVLYTTTTTTTTTNNNNNNNNNDDDNDEILCYVLHFKFSKCEI